MSHIVQIKGKQLTLMYISLLPDHCKTMKYKLTYNVMPYYKFIIIFFIRKEISYLLFLEELEFQAFLHSLCYFCFKECLTKLFYAVQGTELVNTAEYTLKC